MKSVVWVERRSVVQAVSLGLLLLVAGPGFGQSSPGGGRSTGGSDLLLLFTMNKPPETTLPDGEVGPEVYHTRTAPRLKPFGGSNVADGQKGTEFTDAERKKHEAGKAVAWASGINDEPANGLLMLFDSVGYERMTLRFDARATRTGSPFMLVEYRLRGRDEYRQLGQRIELKTDSEFHEVKVDLSGAPGIDGKAEIEIRWVLAPGTSRNGTTRIDNIQVTGYKRG